MKVGDWVIVEDCNRKYLVGKVSRILSPSSTSVYISFRNDPLIWDPKEGDFDSCLRRVGLGDGWRAKVRPLTLLEKELYEL